MSTGRYYITTPSGRKFCVEPIAERNQKIDGPIYKNGGVTGEGVKSDQKGGAIREHESIITPENNFKNIVMLPAGHSPNGFIEALTACTTVEEEEAILSKYRI